MDTLTFTWVLPYTGDLFDSRPLQYHSHLIGHEGENSLLSYLKREELAVGLSSAPSHDLWGITFFDVTVSLTQKGLNDYEKVMEAVFAYAQLVAANEP